MNIVDSISLFTIMMTLAIIPSTSVALVVTRSISLSISNGVAVAIGIVLGDLFFIFLALFGLSFIAETMGVLFILIKYLGGIYLFWIGYQLLASNKLTSMTIDGSNTKGNLFTSFIAGFFLTLGDIKAIFFYISLFPTFLDLTSLTQLDLWLIIVITIVTVGGVKIAYAFSARKIISHFKNQKLESGAKKIAGSFMMGAGSYLIIKA